MPKPFTEWITTNCGKFFKRWKYKTTLRASWETCMQIKKQHGTVDWLKIGKGAWQGCILSPCLFNLYAECIMWNIRLDEAQAGNKISRRNINNLRYADDTTLRSEREEEIKSLLLRVKEESEKYGLKLNIHTTRKTEHKFQIVHILLWIYSCLQFTNGIIFFYKIMMSMRWSPSGISL